MNIDLSQSPRQEQRLAPQTLQVMKLLCYNSQELQEFSQEQFETNPALEFAPPAARETTASPRGGRRAAHEDIAQWEIQKPLTFSERLYSQLDFYSLNAAEIRAARVIIDSLEDNGFLLTELSAISKASGIPEKALERGLSAVQELEPAGIAARSVSECLLLQLRAEGNDDPILRAMIADNLLLVAQRKYGDIARARGITAKQAAAYSDTVRAMRPYPCVDSGAIEYIVPDVSIVKGDDGLEVQWCDDDLPSLCIDPDFRVPGAEATDEERGYCKSCLQAGRATLRMIEMRRATLEKIIRFILSSQRDYFSGRGPIRPVSFQSAADAIGMHASTVYRAIQNKYLRCGGGTYPLRHFLQQEAGGGSGVSRDAAKKLIREMVGETPAISDREVSERLAGRGITVARRTVAKYRAEMLLHKRKS